MPLHDATNLRGRFSHNKWKLVLMLILLVSVVLSGCGGDDDKAADKNEGEQENQPFQAVVIDLKGDPSQVVAEYEGGQVTNEQLEKYLQIQAFLNPQYAEFMREPDKEMLDGFLKNYITELVLKERGTPEGDVEKKAEETLKQVKEQYAAFLGGDDKVKETMKEQSLSDKDIKEYFIRNFYVESYFVSKITSEREKDMYSKNKEDGEYTIASVRHILIGNENRSDEEAKKLAEDITKRLQGGEDFAALAKEYSDDPGSKDNGGLYKDARVTDWVPEFKQAAIELEIGAISDPVKTDYGYHVMKVEDRKELSFEEVIASEEEKSRLDETLMAEDYEQFLSVELEKMIKKINLPETTKQS